MYQSTVPCPKCGAQNLRGQWVCAYCGNTLVVYCPSCHTGNAIDSQYCHACHAVLAYTGVPPAQPQYQPQPQQPQPYPQYPQYPPGQTDQGQYPPQYPPYPPPGYPPQQPPYPDYQAGYGQPGDYKPYSVHGGEAYAGGGLDGLIDRLKEFVRNTNPILLSSLVVLVVGLTIFLILAFQFGWIKTGSAPKVETVKDTTAPVITYLTYEPGENRSIIIIWATNEPASTRVEWGIAPVFNQFTLIENDPQVGQGTLSHRVTLTNLLPNTSYIYRAISYDKAGNKCMSPTMPFQTTNY
ncbi:MAG: fibronectin type III domain-containing protein [Dehalococcoidia bacterium]|jgi:ribosomal protein L32